ncbi:hypothetical protein EVAR_37067_1 [Eumeta japonica]|uniref:Uncharacterized protein n=1 Tax=Eumeta variegata TaxID=151549 RepID=A0A4C1WHI5_EUMVA|nr:hypothetical protein EVAR_37067_1 [Eumeta japonica]
MIKPRECGCEILIKNRLARRGGIVRAPTPLQINNLCRINVHEYRNEIRETVSSECRLKISATIRSYQRAALLLATVYHYADEVGVPTTATLLPGCITRIAIVQSALIYLITGFELLKVSRSSRAGPIAICACVFVEFGAVVVVRFLRQCLRS